MEDVLGMVAIMVALECFFWLRIFNPVIRIIWGCMLRFYHEDQIAVMLECLPVIVQDCLSPDAPWEEPITLEDQLSKTNEILLQMQELKARLRKLQAGHVSHARAPSGSGRDQ